MPSDKHNLMMVIATNLISLLFNFTSSRDLHFCQPQQLQCLYLILMLASWFYQSLSFLFLSPLQCRWWFAVYTLWLQCETWVSAVLAGAFLILFFAWTVPKVFKVVGNEMQWHSSVMEWHNHFLMDYWDRCLDNWTFFIFSIMAGLIAEKLSIYNTV